MAGLTPPAMSGAAHPRTSAGIGARTLEPTIPDVQIRHKDGSGPLWRGRRHGVGQPRDAGSPCSRARAGTGRWRGLEYPDDGPRRTDQLHDAPRRVNEKRSRWTDTSDHLIDPAMVSVVLWPLAGRLSARVFADAAEPVAGGSSTSATPGLPGPTECPFATRTTYREVSACLAKNRTVVAPTLLALGADPGRRRLAQHFSCLWVMAAAAWSGAACRGRPAFEAGARRRSGLDRAAPSSLASRAGSVIAAHDRCPQAATCHAKQSEILSVCCRHIARRSYRGKFRSTTEGL